jgi:hypothetical protein
VLFHEVAKDFDRKAMPPLAKLHLDGQSCNGLSDLFYVAAVTIKKLVDKQFSTSEVLTAHLTMLTLLSDSGFYQEAEKHLENALQMQSSDPSLRMRSLLMTPAVFESFQHLHDTRALLERRLTNISEDSSFLLKTLDELSLSPIFYFIYQGYNDASFMKRLQEIYTTAHPHLVSYKIDRRPTALLGTPVDRRSLSDPLITDIAESDRKTETEEEKENEIPTIRIGFVSSHFRRHSICKLFCHVIAGLSSHTHVIPSSGEQLRYETYVFSGQDQSKEDAFTTHLKQNVKEFIRVKRFTTASRREVTSRFIDVLIYLDIGMDPSTSVWGASKLAPIQVCLWGHPTTTGMGSMDYFISADAYHNHLSENPTRRLLHNSSQIENYGELNTERSFTEQLVRLPSSALGFSFQKPTLEIPSDASTVDSPPLDFVNRPDSLLTSIGALMLNSSLPSSASDAITSLEAMVQMKLINGSQFILIPQHLPKFHPMMDSLLSQILSTLPNSYLVITYETKRTIWRRTLEKRWRTSGLMTAEMITNRILWLSHLTPQQYLGLLAIGDVMLDPYPFGGGVTTLEALSVCTPVLTLPFKQTVPSLASGMIQILFNEYPETEKDNLFKEFIFENENNLLQQIQNILQETIKRVSLRQVICDNNHRLYTGFEVSQQTITEWGNFLFTVSQNNFF